jgi:MFS family permease
VAESAGPGDGGEATVPGAASPSQVRIVAGASAALAGVTLPAFLVGALTVQVGAELGFGEAGAGAAIAVMFAAAGLAAVPVGRLTQRLTPRTAIRTGSLGAAIVCLAIAAVADRWWVLALLLACVGVCVVFVDTGAARAFSTTVDPRQHGLVFGVKEASVPAATMLAGLSLPALVIPLGWRAAFVAAAAVPLVAWPTLPATGALAPAAGKERHRLSRPVLLLAVGVGCAAAAANASATFLVPWVASTGVPLGRAGGVLAAASVATIVVRIVLGWATDRSRSAPAGTVAVAMAVGALGALAASLVTGLPLTVLAAFALLGGGWGWTGVAFHAAVRARPDAPAVAAGAVLGGLAIGGAAGPLAFGWLASRSYPLAWTCAAIALAAGSAVVALARRGL